MCARQWLKSEQLIEQDIQSVSHSLHLSYEDLCANPGNELGRIADFLGLPAFSEEIAGQSWNIHNNASAIRNMNARSIARLAPDQIATIRDVAGVTLDKYGYTATGE